MLWSVIGDMHVEQHQQYGLIPPVADVHDIKSVVRAEFFFFSFLLSFFFYLHIKWRGVGVGPGQGLVVFLVK